MYVLCHDRELRFTEGEKTLAQGHQPVGCPNQVFWAHQPSGVLYVRGVLVVAGCVPVAC